MTNTAFRMTVLTAAAAMGLVLVGSGAAGAITWHKCPDGTIVTDSQAWKCKFKKILKPSPTFPAQAAGLGLKGNTNQQQGQAPKPKDSTKKWQDYIFEGAKPPKPRPK